MIRQKIRLGDLLVNEGLISQDDLMRALSIQKKYRENGVFKKIGEILIEEGLITEKQMSITCLLYTSPSPRDS
jgi:type IV pilus assembly protein PilB